MTWSGYQRKKLHHGLGDHTFKEIAAEAGVDNDKDGRGIGIVRLRQRRPPRHLPDECRPGGAPVQERRPGRGNWVELALTGAHMRDAFGARVTLTAGGRTQIREVDGGNGYAGQSMHRLHFGLGDATRVDCRH